MRHCEKINQANNLENESKWDEAAKVWKSIDRIEDANACLHISKAIAKADAFRAEVARTIGEEPELTYSNLHAAQEWHHNLAVIYRKHFKSE